MKKKINNRKRYDRRVRLAAAYRAREDRRSRVAATNPPWRKVDPPKAEEPKRSPEEAALLAECERLKDVIALDHTAAGWKAIDAEIEALGSAWTLFMEDEGLYFDAGETKKEEAAASRSAAASSSSASMAPPVEPAEEVPASALAKLPATAKAGNWTPIPMFTGGNVKAKPKAKNFATGRKKYCFAFKRGSCNQGSDCPYPHDQGGTIDMLTGDDAILALTPPAVEGWTRIDATIDSGSACSCVPADMVVGEVEPVADGPKSYTSASSHTVEVVGMIRPRCAFQNGVEGTVELKVLKGLKRPLFSTDVLNKKGYDVIHRKELSYMVHRESGAEFRIYSRNGVFVMPVWVDSAFLGRGPPSP